MGIIPKRIDTQSEQHHSLIGNGGDGAVPAHHQANANGGVMPKAGVTRSTNELLSSDNVSAVRRANVEGQLKSNLWYEVSRIALWATTGLIALTVMSLAGSVSVPFMVPLLGSVAAAGVLLASSQHSKQVFANRWFDVQDFQMQRQAALVGKSVEHAIEGQGVQPHTPTHWSAKFSAEQAPESWSQAVEADKASAAASATAIRA